MCGELFAGQWFPKYGNAVSTGTKFVFISSKSKKSEANLP